MMLTYLLQEIFWILLFMPLALVAFAGFNLSLLLSLFQLQEGTLVYLSKLTVFLIVLIYLADFFMNKFSELYQEIYWLIINV